MKPKPNPHDITRHPCGGMTVEETAAWRNAQAEQGWTTRGRSIHPRNWYKKPIYRREP